jgi:hypothetical protein
VYYPNCPLTLLLHSAPNRTKIVLLVIGETDIPNVLGAIKVVWEAIGEILPMNENI